MRTLEFKVNGQKISKLDTCDFSGIVSGSSGFLQCAFKFSSDWNRCKVAASFYNKGRESAVPVINNKCEIPTESLTSDRFYIKLTGEKNGYRITTNKLRIRQEG